MAEQRLQAAIQREEERIARLREEMHTEYERGFRRTIQNRITRAQTLRECLRYALNLVKGLEPYDPFEGHKW